MNLVSNTAVVTAIEGFPASGKTLLALIPVLKPRQSGEAKPKLLSKECGITFEHGKFTASAGIDPGTKKRIRKFGFATEKEAVEWRAKKLSTKTSDQAERRQKLREMTEGEIVDAAEALERLDKAGLIKGGILRVVAEDYIARHPEATATTVRQFYETWLNSKKERGRRYHTISSAKGAMSTFLKKHGDLPLVEVDYEKHIHNFVFDPAIPNATTRRGRGVVITNFFNVAQKRGLIGSQFKDHPCFALELPDKPEGNPDPWSVTDFKTLLAFAWATEDTYHATAYVAIGGLAGVRTEELARIPFGPDGVDIDAGRIRISGDNAKKRRARIVDMDAGLQRLLIALRDRPRNRLKYVRPLPRPTDLGAKVFSRKSLHEFKGALRTPLSEGGAGIPIIDQGGRIHVSMRGRKTINGPSAWRANGLRAAFATYHFEKHGDARFTAALMGHTGDLSVFFHHYRALAQKGDGNAYFAIADQVIAEM